LKNRPAVDNLQSQRQGWKLGNRNCRKFTIALIFLLFIICSGFSKTGTLGHKIGNPDKAWVERNLKNLSLREKIAQLVQIRVQGKFINSEAPEFQALKEQVTRTRIGGIVLFAGNIYESAILLNELQQASKLPLIVSSDFERGASFRIADTTSFPWTMALGATGSEDLAYQEGLITAQESRAMGVHWIFAPVLDVNNNPENPVINIRSYGEDPNLVARLGAAFIKGARDGGVLTTAKHFPGHGDTATDSHLGLAVVDSNLARLEAVELVPFRKAISVGVDSIMTAHVAVPKVTGSAETPATLSESILTGMLRKSMKFSGIVVTDALEMGGIANRYWPGLAAVRAIEAGADVVLLPANVATAIEEIERAVKRGEIAESRIDLSVKKILNAKSSLGLHINRFAAVGKIRTAVASPRSTKLAQEIADHSITAVKDEQHLLPLDPTKAQRITSLVLASDVDSSPLSIFQSEMRRRFPSIRTMGGDSRISEELSDEMEKAALQSDLIVCSTVIRLASGQSAVSIPRRQHELLEILQASGKPFIWVAFGNPYVLRLAPSTSTYLCTFSYSDTSQIAAAKALSGEIAIGGRLPVSIPSLFRIGAGMQIPKIEMTLKMDSPISGNYDETKQLLSSFIESGAIPGAAIVVGKKNSVIWEYYAGKQSNSDASAGISPKTIQALSSLSEVVGTISAAMMEVSSKDLILSAPVRDYLPENTSVETNDLLISDLLSRYSNAASNSDKLLLNEIVSRASGSSLDRVLAGRLFRPLGIGKTTQLQSTARDLAVFAQMMLNGGIYDHRRYFDRSILAQFTAGNKAMGWSKPSGWTERLFSKTAFGHNSSSGSALWIDPEKQLFIIFLTNAQSKEHAAEVQQNIIESLARSVAAQE
jgi:beta-N-acetylhexosaminidase